MKFKTSMLRSNLCDYSDAYILVSATITATNSPKHRNRSSKPKQQKNIIIENCTPFTNCSSEIKNTQLDNAKGIDTVIPMNNLIEYFDNYSKTSRSLWQSYRDESFINYDGAITDFPADNNNSASFKFKTKIAGRIGEDGTKTVKIRVPLKYLSNFWITIKMPLINCEINYILTFPVRCFINNPYAGQESTFTITDKKTFCSSCNFINSRQYKPA